MPSRNRHRRRKHVCDIYGCSHPKTMRVELPCCKKKVCGTCALNLLKASYLEKGFILGIKCPFCRSMCVYDEQCNWVADKSSNMKTLMARCNIREKEFSFRCQTLQNQFGNLRMRSVACPHGCHGCFGSALEVDFLLNAEMAREALQDHDDMATEINRLREELQNVATND